MKSVMTKMAARAAGQAARQAAQKHVGEGAFIDPRRGWAMLRDREVAPSTKFLALVLGIALTAGLNVAEVPLETVIAFFLPFFGFGFDLVLNGIELIVGPILFGAMLLPHLVALRDENRRRNAPATIPVETLPPTYRKR